MRKSNSDQIRAEVNNIVPSAESAFYVTGVITFRNNSSKTATIRKYKLVWPSGIVELKVTKFELLPNQSLQRTVRIEPKHGNIKDIVENPSLVSVELG